MAATLDNNRGGWLVRLLRREQAGCAIALAAAVLFCGWLACPRACAFGRNYQVRQIAPNTYVWIPDDIVDQSGDQYFSRAGNVGFVITPDGVVVVNTTNNPSHARDVLYEIRQRTQLPVQLVIDLGPEGDQMLGNEVFAEQRATIISSQAAQSGMQAYDRDLAHRMTFDSELPKRMRGIHFTLPGQTFHGRESLNVGGVVIRIVALDCGVPGADSGDAAVYLPQQKVLFLGDLYVHGFVPQVGTRDVNRWIGVLGEVEKWNVATYVPGHGEPGGRAGVAAFRGFLEWLNAGVKGGVLQGKSLGDVEQQLLSSSAFNLLGLDLAPRAIAEVYRQITDARSARIPPQHTLPLTAPHPPSGAVPPDAAAQGFRSAPPPASVHP